MMGNVTSIDFKDIKSAIPAFLTIIVMILGYSITKGIGFGIISYVFITTLIYIVDLVKYNLAPNKQELEKPKYEVSIVALVVFALFLFYFLVPIK